MGVANYLFNIYQNKCSFKLKLSALNPKNETCAKEPNVKSVAGGHLTTRPAAFLLGFMQIEGQFAIQNALL
jgi:hypothetical protein